MKIKFIFLISFYIVNISKIFSQQISVYDKFSNRGIKDVLIANPKKKIYIYTDSAGKADISILNKSDTVVISHIKYKNITGRYDKILKEMVNKNNNLILFLEPDNFYFKEIVISANKFEENIEEIPRQIEVIQRKDIEQSNVQNSADVLSSNTNVFVQKSQMGGGSPVLRGFEANKVLLVIDGVRMNNAIYRSGHLQNVITIEPFMLDKVEVIFGPGPVIYGSDALGGVMHFYTRKIEFASKQDSFKLNASTLARFSSANNENTGAIYFNIGLKKWAFLSALNYSNFGHLRQGGFRNPFYGDWGKRYFFVQNINGKDSIIPNFDANIQRPSAYQQYGFLQKIAYKANSNLKHIFNFQYSKSSNIPRYDRLTELRNNLPKYAEWYYGPQKRIFSSYSIIGKNYKLFDDFKMIIAFQNVEESRHTRLFNDSIIKNRKEHVDILLFNADFSKLLGKNEFRTGVEINSNFLSSNAFGKNIYNSKEVSISTRYPDDSQMHTAAIYLSHALEINNKIIFRDGIRYNYTFLKAPFKDKSFYPFPFDEVIQKNNAFNGNLGFVFTPGKDWRLILTGTTAFRVPNIDDLAKVFESVPGNVIVPNPNLKPEYLYSGEFGIDKIFYNILKVKNGIYYTYYKDALTIMPYLFQGKDSIFYDGIKSKVFSNVNAKNAYVYGLYTTLEAKISRNFTITSSINYTYGRIKSDTGLIPKDHIAPVYGKTLLNYENKSFQTAFYVFYNGWKYKKDYNLYGEDNFSKATQFGTPAWFTLNYSFSYMLNSNVKVQFAVENILDYNYRVFSSGISAPGRNFIISLRGYL